MIGSRPMRLKTKKRLLNLTSALLLAAAGAVGYWGTTPSRGIGDDVPANGTAPRVEAAKGKGPGNLPVGMAQSASSGIGAGVNWSRLLRRPLFDPPPPAPIVAVKPSPQPVRAKLLATLIESENSTAMLKLADGQVVFRKLGESLGPEESSAEICKIETGAISVRRGKEEIRLSVDGSGK